MTDKPTYKELEKQIAELKKQIAFDNEKKSKFEAELLNEIKRRHEIEYNLSKYKSLFEAVIKQAPFAAHVIEGSFNNLKVLLDNDESRRIMDESFEDTSVIDADKSDMLKTRFFSTDGKTEIPLKLMPSPRAFKGEIVTNEEFLFRHASGKEIFVEANAFPIFDETQNIIAVVVTFHDISERKKTEQALKESEEKYRNDFQFLHAILDSPINIIVFSLDKNYCYTAFTKFHKETIKKIWGVDIQIGMNMLDIILNLEDRQKAKNNFDRALNGEYFILTEEYGNKALYRTYYENFYSSIKNSNGEIVGVSVFVVDATERKNAEQELKESEKKFKEIINQINDGIIVFDEQGKILIFNKGAEQIFDLNADDFINNSIVAIQYKFAPPQFKDKTLIENVIKGIVTLKTPEVFNKIIDNETAINSGKIINLQSNVFPIKLDNYYLFCSVFRDTTELKQYEKQLIQLNSDKDRFMQILAHDLKSPFNSLLGFSELLLKNLRKYDIDKIEKQLKFIHQTTHKTYNLLEDLLLWSKAQSGKITVKHEKIVFNEICSEIINNSKHQADIKEISINCFEPEKTILSADLNMIKTILRNLISNAIKFTNHGGQIEISTEKNDEDVTIIVSDNGIGIQPEVLTTLFDISKIYTTEGTANESGSGLGLLLCKDFVEIHGGKIWVESEVDKGSDFKFTMPLFND